MALPFWPDFTLEYALGFGFGWAFFQDFAMRDMAGGSYVESLKMTFLPELLSMNLLMAGMQLTARFSMKNVNGGDDPARPEFWFIMSMALLVGFVFAYPINWWLGANHMKHGMLTVRKEPSMAMTSAGHAGGHSPAQRPAMQPKPARPSLGAKAAMTALSFGILGAALLIVTVFAV